MTEFQKIAWKFESELTKIIATDSLSVTFYLYHAIAVLTDDMCDIKKKSMCFYTMKTHAIVQLRLLALLHELLFLVLLGQCWLFFVWVFVVWVGFFAMQTCDATRMKSQQFILIICSRIFYTK